MDKLFGIALVNNSFPAMEINIKYWRETFVRCRLYPQSQLRNTRSVGSVENNWRRLSSWSLVFGEDIWS